MSKEIEGRPIKTTESTYYTGKHSFFWLRRNNLWPNTFPPKAHNKCWRKNTDSWPLAVEYKSKTTLHSNKFAENFHFPMHLRVLTLILL